MGLREWFILLSQVYTACRRIWSFSAVSEQLVWFLELKNNCYRNVKLPKTWKLNSCTVTLSVFTALEISCRMTQKCCVHRKASCGCWQHEFPLGIYCSSAVLKQERLERENLLPAMFYCFADTVTETPLGKRCPAVSMFSLGNKSFISFQLS